MKKSPKEILDGIKEKVDSSIKNQIQGRILDKWNQNLKGNSEEDMEDKIEECQKIAKIDGLSNLENLENFILFKKILKKLRRPEDERIKKLHKRFFG